MEKEYCRYYKTLAIPQRKATVWGQPTPVQAEKRTEKIAGLSLTDVGYFLRLD